MTTYQGIAAVTQSIRYLVESAVRVVVPEASTTLDSPDRYAVASRDEPRIGISLLQAVPDAALRNADLPARDADGHPLGPTKLALNLHYLLTFFGPAPSAQLMLGAAALALRQHAYLDAALVADAVGGHGDLDDSGLDRQSPVVLSQLSAGLEELSRIWSGFFQVPYVLSAIYEASGLVIEDAVEPAASVPVREVDVHASAG